jgi:hypothetical protein
MMKAISDLRVVALYACDRAEALVLEMHNAMPEQQHYMAITADKLLQIVSTLTQIAHDYPELREELLGRLDVLQKPLAGCSHCEAVLAARRKQQGA